MNKEIDIDAADYLYAQDYFIDQHDSVDWGKNGF